MHVHFEQNTCTRTDSNFLSLSWMGKVPEDLPEEGGGWKLNRAQYYVEGWLASGNARGVVGVTFSTSHCHRYDAPPRSNFNLRGHRSEVILVRWNEPYQKLATCDSRGVIFVWIKHEGRWSIELINDRNSQVTDFAWSHDGRMALICYRDGFILVGSVAGQRYWSSMLHLDNTTITCGLWSPDDQQVMFGTLDGQIIVMSSSGTVVTQLTIHEGYEITGMAWSCERFNMEEAETTVGRDAGDNVSDSSTSKQHVLAVCFKYGEIFLMTGYDDPSPITIYTALTGVKMDWSNCGEYLAVGGFVRQPNLQCRNEVHFYSKDGTLVHWVRIPSQGKPLSALTWGHNDKRLFIAAGCHMYVAWVSKQVAPLNFLCQRIIHQAVRTERAVEKLPIPQRLRCGIKALFSPTVKSYIPEPLHLREFVCWPPPGGERLFCTMIRHGEETSGGHYTLYLEYLGGLVPLLKGKRASKLRPDFIIFDPKIKSSGKVDQNQQSGSIESDSSSESDPDVFSDGCGSPRMQRKRRHKVFRAEKVNRSITFRTLDELMFDDNLPETNRLVEVTSNIWGTKFQITGLASSLPSCLGQIVYKTSLLHLQPRQMTITISEITPSRQVLSRDPNFTPAPASDDEDSFWSTDADGPQEKVVQVTVHDAPVIGADDASQGKGDIVSTESGTRTSAGSTPLIEHSADLVSLAGKLSNSGTVRSRSLSPVRNSLTQTTPAFKQDSVNGHHTQDSSRWQGARPKTSLKRNSHQNNSNSNAPNGNTTRPSNNNNNNHSNNINNANSNTMMCTSLSTATSYSKSGTQPGNQRAGSLLSNGNLNLGANNSTSSYANTNGIIANPQSTAASESSFSSAQNHGSKKVELVRGFKRLDLNNSDMRGRSGDFTPGSCAWMPIGESVTVIAKDKKVEYGEAQRNPFLSDKVVSPVVSDERTALRWADPASQAVKLMEDEANDGAELPYESNLVADCSPTAPFSHDFHRRLYLAHQHIVENGAPISPTNCPSCLPSQRSSMCGVNMERSSCHVAQGTTTPNTTKADIPQQYFIKAMSMPSPSSSLSSSSSSHKTAGKKSDTSNLPNYGLLSEMTDLSYQAWSNHSHAFPNQQSCIPNCSDKHRDSSADENQVRKELLQVSSSPRSRSPNADNLSLPISSASSLSSSSSSSPTSSSKEDFSLCHKSAPPSNYPPSTTHHEPPQDVSPSTYHHIFHKPQDSHSSKLTSDLSSSDKLALLLSEDPSNQESAHNFQSMPGFVMRNPNLSEDNNDTAILPSPDKESIHEDLDLTSTTFKDNKMAASLHDLDIHQTSASMPSSPIRFGLKSDQDAQAVQQIFKGRCRHLSPLMQRKGRTSSQDTYLGSDGPQGYHSLEVFQKAQLRQKIRRRTIGPAGRLEQGRTFTMHNKAPLWNETSQVYQLDFGGRVTQESAKNFQIELRGKQVMQFGRIDNNAYTLDFQYPFTAVQAFAVALANVTQRLK